MSPVTSAGSVSAAPGGRPGRGRTGHPFDQGGRTSMSNIVNAGNLGIAETRRGDQVARIKKALDSGPGPTTSSASSFATRARHKLVVAKP